MRLFLILVASVIGFAAGYFALGLRQSAEAQARRAELEAAWQADKAALEKALQEARIRPGDSSPLAVPSAALGSGGGITNSSPEEILNRLIQLRPGAASESRNRVMRQVVHQLQLLAELGPPALPAIQQFIARNKDVDYTMEEVAEARDHLLAADRVASRNLTRTDFLVPPSLRLGLVDVMDQIGGDYAERILAEMLTTTGRGVEVAFVARVLQENAPNKYREVALTAAKDLLANPPAIDQPDRFDDNARAYLYEVLSLYHDTSFAETARGLLVTPDGRVDRNALSYLSAAAKEQAMTSIYQAYKDSRLTNQWEKTALLNVALNYVGPSTEANQMLSDVLRNEALPPGTRAFAVQSLAGGWRSETPTDPALIKARIELLDQWKGTTRDARILKAMEDAAANLQRLLTGETDPGVAGPPGRAPGAAATPASPGAPAPK